MVALNVNKLFDFQEDRAQPPTFLPYPPPPPLSRASSMQLLMFLYNREASRVVLIPFLKIVQANQLAEQVTYEAQRKEIKPLHWLFGLHRSEAGK